LLELGKALCEDKQWQESLYYIDCARTIFEAVGSNLYLALSYRWISRAHVGEHRLPDALEAMEEAWKYIKLTDHRFDQSNISLDLSIILFKTNQDSKAWKYIKIALINASYIGARLNVGHALVYMGYGYLRRGDYQNAYGAYDAAAEKYSGTIYAGSGQHCKENMARIKRKQRNPDEVVGFYRHFLDRDNTLFYPSVQAFASELPVFILS
jgi:tetratricopeptide (TPR) repeat protein